MSESTMKLPDPERGRASIVFETPDGTVESFEVDNEFLVCSSGRTR